MKSFFEFHDSCMSHIERSPAAISIVFAHAYLYEFEAAPFEEPGRGISQKARLVLTGVNSSALK